MQEYVLSSHAETVLVERSIRAEWLDRVLKNPERTEADREDADLKHALGRISEFGGRVLRVVYNDATKPVMIVTTYFDRTMKDKL
ncbi:MAG: DUF4258 domain-containing protein [Betaproteobacteria bacterium]|nr:DUF4258 domain-containing protein [Betaproteobacteria bacterium]